MRNSLEDYNASKPAVDQVHGVEGDTGELDDGVVASCEEEQGNHVDDSHDTSAVAELTGGGSVTLAPVNLPHAQPDIGGEVADKQKSLQTAGQCANVDGGREPELAMVTGAEERRIQAVFPEAGEEPVGCRKVSLGVVVEASQRTKVLGEVEDDLVDEEGADKGNPDPAEVVHDIHVLNGGSVVLLSSTSTISADDGLHHGVGNGRSHCVSVERRRGLDLLQAGCKNQTSGRRSLMATVPVEWHRDRRERYV